MNRLAKIAVLLCSLPHLSWADVTLVRTIESAGFRGMGGSTTSETLVIQGSRQRREHRIKMTGSMLGAMMKDRHQATLTLLDQDVIQTLNLPKKTYTEMSLKDLVGKAENALHSQDEEKPEKESKPTHKISKAEFKVTPTGKSKTLHGFPCKEVVMTMLLQIEDLETHAKTETRMVTTLWMTPETGPLAQARKEETAFSKAYLKKLGVDFNAKDMKDFGAVMAAALTGAGEKEVSKALARMPEEIKKIGGYPIVTQTDWYLNEEEAGSEAVAPSSASEESGVDLSGGVEGALGGLASKWASKKVEKKMADRQKAQAGKPAFSVTSELQSLSTATAPDSAFAVPAGFKKVGK